jgi:hypothetical protein
MPKTLKNKGFLNSGDWIRTPSGFHGETAIPKTDGAKSEHFFTISDPDLALNVARWPAFTLQQKQ